ncbi:MAG: hypothetical protein QM499_11215 [Flavobacteriaceae bacterium]
MAPIKFDDHIREQLQEREIQPSNTAWERLNNELGKSSKKDRKTPVYAIAASIVGLIVVASLVFKGQTNSIIETDKIVETGNNTNEEIQKEPFFNTKNNELVVATETQNGKENISEASMNSEKRNTISNNKNLTETVEITFNNSEEKILIDPIEKPVIASENKTDTSESDFIELKIAEVVAEVTAIKKSNNKVSDDEINALLKKAQLEIQSQKLIANKKVDATALLNIVEEEIETSFRDKVFDALGEQFEKVRTAVVDRNN